MNQSINQSIYRNSKIFYDETHRNEKCNELLHYKRFKYDDEIEDDEDLNE